MPPFLSTFRSRTNSLLETITGVIPDSPPDGTFKDRSLTCRKCGNRFRDALELSSHFNLLPHHSDYSDSHDYASFIRPKARRTKIAPAPLVDAAEPAPVAAGFSEAEAFYAVQDKENRIDRPALLRKFPTLSNLTTATSAEQQPMQTGTDYADGDGAPQSPSAKAKGKQKAFPLLRREDSYPFGQPLYSSDEDEDSKAPGPSSAPQISSLRSRARSATTQALMPEPALPPRPRSSTSSSVASKSTISRRQAPPLPPKIPAFDWENDDAASIHSDASFCTAGSTEHPDEKAAFKKDSKAGWGSSKASDRDHSASVSARDKRRHDRRPDNMRHMSESDLLLHSADAPDYDAPPSYHELHGDTDPFDDLTSRTGSASRPHASRRAHSRSEGFASMPTSPINRLHIGTSQRPRRSTNAWLASASPVFPVSFASAAHPWSTGESELYSSNDAKPKLDASLPPLAASSALSSPASPSSPSTPFAAFGDLPRSSSPFALTLPNPPQNPSNARSSEAGATRKRHTSRAKSDAAAPSTRCPTCFTKFASLDKTLEHMDNSDCGAIEFESGIM